MEDGDYPVLLERPLETELEKAGFPLGPRIYFDELYRNVLADLIIASETDPRLLPVLEKMKRGEDITRADRSVLIVSRGIDSRFGMHITDTPLFKRETDTDRKVNLRFEVDSKKADSNYLKHNKFGRFGTGENRNRINGFLEQNPYSSWVCLYGNESILFQFCAESEDGIYCFDADKDSSHLLPFNEFINKPVTPESQTALAKGVSEYMLLMDAIL